MKRWRQRLEAILDWSPVDKSLLVMLALTAVLAGNLAAILLALGRPDRERFVHVAPLEHLLTLQALLLAGALIIVSLCLLLREQRPHSLWLQHLATQYYTLSLVSSSYFVGTLTFSTGIVLVGAAVFGFILLERRVVWWAVATGTGSVLGLAYGAAWDWLPYAPVVVAPTDMATRLWWMTAMLLFSVPHVVVILVFADQTVAWWRQREATIRTLSSTDMLTGLANRRSILELLEKEVARSRRDQQPLSVVLLDLDHFKRINDTWGHATGDRALQVSARALHDTLRLGDAIGRYGGEEFLMLLPGTRLEGARALLERCRLLLAEATVESDDGSAVHLSASFGLSSNEIAPGLDAGVLIRMADEALYRAKAGGRNRVEVMEAVAA